MRMLQRYFDVETRYGGGFVQEIDGIAGGRENGRPVDWFYYVNGIEAERRRRPQVAAGRPRLVGPPRLGRDAGVPAVVGAFPEPFLVRRRRQADARAARLRRRRRRRLRRGRRAAGGRRHQGRRRPAAAGSGGEGVLRIVVGPWAEMRRDPAVRQLEEGPRASGVFARPTPSGTAIALLDPAGEVVAHARARQRARRRHAALGGEPPTWVVTGTDEAGVAAAAAQLREDALARPLRDRRRRRAARCRCPSSRSAETP